MSRVVVLLLLLTTGAAMADTAETPEARLAAAGHTLPPPPKPVATYVTSVRTGNLLFLSGHGECGESYTRGKLGRDLTVEVRHLPVLVFVHVVDLIVDARRIEVGRQQDRDPVADVVLRAAAVAGQLGVLGTIPPAAERAEAYRAGEQFAKVTPHAAHPSPRQPRGG